MPPTRADREREDEVLENVRAAKAGDPQAVREILRALEAFLRGENPIPRCYAVFCADSIAAFLEDDRAWERLLDEHDNWLSPAEEFEARDRSEDSPVERILGLGARLPVRRLRRIGTAACRALHLTRQRPPAIGRPRVLAPEEESSLQDQAIRFTDYFDMRAELTTCAAEEGDPSALRKLLRAVECSLYEEKSVPGRFAFFCADALKQWLEDREAWERIESYVRQTGPGSRAPINHVRPLARSFCQTFRLSRPKRLPRRGESPHEIPFSPTSVYQFERLLAHGVTWRQAQVIVSSAYPSLSSRTLDEWARLMEIRVSSIGEGRLMAHRLELAERVEAEIAQGRSQEDAEMAVARWLAQRVFPSGPSRVERWAEHVLQESKLDRTRPEEHLELARQIKAASGPGELLSEIPDKLYQEILPEVVAEETETFLPDPLIAKLIPAIRSAQALALKVIVQ